MRILLDECLPKRLGRLMVGHQIRTVQQMAWSGIKNGRLLSLAQNQFDVFVTVDRGFTYQQYVVDYDIAVVVLSAPSNRFVDLSPLIPATLTALPTLQPGAFFVITNPLVGDSPDPSQPGDDDATQIEETP